MSDRVIFVAKNLPAEIHHALAANVDSSEFKRSTMKLAEPSVLYPNVGYSIESSNDSDPKADRDLKVEFAAPSVLMGSNIALHNNPYEAVCAAIKNIQINLRRRGFDHKLCQQLKISACDLTSAEFTYCFKCSSPAEALKLLALIGFRAHAIHGEKATSVISCDRETVYVNHLPEGSLKVYIKSLKVKSTVFEVEDADARNQLAELAPCLVRIEFIVNGRTISKGIPGLDNVKVFGRRVLSWQCKHLEEGPAEPVFKFIRKALWLDRPLAAERVNPLELDILGPYQEVLQAYFDGADPRELPYFAHLDGDKLSKRFSACKQEIYKACQIDITIPWVKVQQLAVDGLGERLAFENHFRVPAELAAHTFTPAGVKASKATMDKLYDEHEPFGHHTSSNQPPMPTKGAKGARGAVGKTGFGVAARRGPPREVTAR